MSEELTSDLPDKRSFEERVFARFDVMDARFNAMEGRFDAVDKRFDAVDKRFDGVEARLEKLEARAYDTKPIWERALAEIVEVKTRVRVIEVEVAAVKANYGGIKTDFENLKRELVRQLTRRLDLVLKTLVDTRDEMAAAEERITKLESQLA
jgi:chromosome segregation ATPase